MDEMSTPSNRAVDELLGEIAEEFSQRISNGEHPDIEDYARRHPDLAATIRQVFPAFEMIGAWHAEPEPSASEPEATQLDIGRIGDFRIKREIGRGGMGVVYEAEQISLHRPVALKVLPFASVLDQRQLQRFKNEAQAAATLHHTNIVPVYSVGSVQGIHFYAMQFIEGQPLSEVIKELRQLCGPERHKDVGDNGLDSQLAHQLLSGNLSRPDSPAIQTCPNPGTPDKPESSATCASKDKNTSLATALAPGHSMNSPRFTRAIVQLAIQVAEALEHAHEREILHRDIKPSNLILDATGTVWVTDFGLARMEGSTQVTVSGDLIGTLRYMSPEQVSAKPKTVDHRTDIYSLGATLYELLGLEPAFPASDRQQLMRQIAAEEPRNPRRVNQAIPFELETIVLKAMAKDPAERYQTAHELADDLKRFLEDKPIRARRASLIRRLAKWRRRHRSLVTSLTIAFALSLVTVTVVSTFLAVRINQAKLDAQAAQADAERIAAEMYVAHGNRLVEDGDVLGSLVWFARSLGLNGKDNTQETPNRLRLVTAIRSMPKLWRVLLCDDTIHFAVVSPVAGRVATSSLKEAQVWDIVTGQLLTSFRHGDQINYLQFDPLGRRVVTASNDLTAQVWDSTTGQPLNQPLTHESPVNHAEFSTDGRYVATATIDGTVSVWDVTTGEKAGPPLKHKFPSTARFQVSLSPDSRWALSTFPFGSARIWDVATGNPVTPYLIHDQQIIGATFTVDGQRILTACSDNTVRTWDTVSGESVAKVRLEDEANRGISVASFSPDSRYVITSSFNDGLAKVFRTSDGKRIASINGFGSPIWAIAFSPNGHSVVTAVSDGRVLLWDLASGQAVTPRWRAEGFVCDLAFVPGGYQALTTSADGSASVWHMPARGRLTPRLRHDQPIEHASLSPDRRLVITASADHTAQLWDVTTGLSVGSPLRHEDIVYHASFSPDARLVVTAGGTRMGSRYFGEARVWNTNTGKLIKTLEHASCANWAVFSHDGNRLVTTTSPFPDSMSPYNNAALVWDLATYQIVTALKHQGRVQCASFSPDDRRVVTASFDGTARVWDATTGTPITPPLRHGERLYYACFGPHGRLVATAGSDQTARVWDAVTGHAITPPLEHDSSVRRTWFSPDGRQLVTASSNGTVQVWDLSDDSCPDQDLILLAGLLAGQAPHLKGVGAQIDGSAMLGAFKKLQGKYPRQFSVIHNDVVTWHERQAYECQGSEQWSEAIWHLKRLIELDSTDAQSHVHRGQIYARLGMWKMAADDFTSAIQKGLQDDDVHSSQNRCLARVGSEVIVPVGSNWRWLHPIDGTDPATDDRDFHSTFFGLDYDDSKWQQGHDSAGVNGGFGYGDHYRANMGMPAPSHRKTAYFRHTFETETQFYNLFVGLEREDGVIIYLDDAEVARDNVSDDAEAYNLLANRNIGSYENPFRFIPLNATIRPGKHVLAISLHNHANYSTDFRIGEISLAGIPSGTKSSSTRDL